MQNFRTRPIIEAEFLGYDDLHPSQLLAPGKFQEIDNAYGSDNKLVKVSGSSSVAASIAAYQFDGLYSFEKISASSKWLIAALDGASSGSIYSWAGSGTFSKISGSSTFTNGARFRFASANDYVFGFNGTEQFDWNGTTFTKNRSGVPIGQYAVWFHNYLFVAGNTANPNRLYFSNLGDPTTFAGANYVDINPGDSDLITGLGVLQDELFVFKRNMVWSVTGWSGTTFAATTVATQNTNVRVVGYGCIAPDSIVAIGNDIYFLTFISGQPEIRALKKTQFAATLGGGIVSYDISGTMANINKSNMGNVVGTFDGRYAYWAIPTGSSTTNNKIIMLDTWGIRKVKNITIYPWTTQTGKNAKFMTVSTISGTAVNYFADTSATSGLVFKFDTSVYTNNGTNITMTVVPRTYMTDPARQSKWVYGYFKYDTGVNSTLTISAKIDKAANFTTQDTIDLNGTSPGLGTFVLGTNILGGQALQKHRTTFKQLTGTMLDLQFTETSNNPVTLYDFEIYAQPKSLRKA